MSRTLTHEGEKCESSRRDVSKLVLGLAASSSRKDLYGSD